MMHWFARYVLGLVVLVLLLYTFASCTPEQVQAWTPTVREIIIAIVAVVGLNMHRNRTRRRALSKLKPKEPPCPPYS
jgi:chromate transport protein ChrA